jgi:hypothetical protein
MGSDIDIPIHTQMKKAGKPQYQDQVDLWTPRVDQVVTIWHRHQVGNQGDMDDFSVTGELLEVKPQGLCVEQPQHPDGEVFVPFSQMRAFENHEKKLYDDDWEFYMKEDYGSNMQALKNTVKFGDYDNLII